MGKKKKVSKTLVEKILDKEKVEYIPTMFETETKGDTQEIVTNENEREGYKIYKTLVLTGNKTGPLVGMVALDKHVSYKKLAKLSGNKKIGMVPLKDLVKTSGFEHGANSPVGIHSLHNYPIYFDNEADKADKIVVSAGKVGYSLIVEPHDLAKVVNATFGDFAVVEPE
ncbi:YbaK/EbsC family protein [Companilactobacillus mishanensis]|uniref:Cys-tRNA(Pro)/Cys-tRNA(Cys) deacylase n=1 Tax=Companilactobacillus mishanensis TaxID=2486008 RepID=A0A5P0ZEV7_9LACO|nr:YbaK/EbsC family protein [Companilactobacillus mishanensis]MQS44340.1 Cys-tRNA(Pro) deacylase [Companilactobacillus mishanensis]MQS51558.1 Cys-tRNA(Pro) deacylase [Companilactobacillus mishanensis]MQS88580.1 Cys-tRNA(Pro) deacylase [Companilactobacillus mishanensis]